MLSAVWFLSVQLTQKPQIIGGCVPGKFSEIPNKMRLVIKIELVRNQRPIDGLGGVNTCQNIAKPIQAAQLFWCTPNIFLDLTDKFFLLIPNLSLSSATGLVPLMPADPATAI